MDFIFTAAYADTAVSAGFDFMGLLPLVLVFVVMYFLLIRPQQKKNQELRQLQQNLKKGDHILTNGGIFGEVVKVISPDQVSLEIADGVKVRVATSMIGSVVPATSKTSNPSPITSTSSALKSRANTTKSSAKKSTTVKKTTPEKKASSTKKPASKTTKSKAKDVSR